MKTVIITGSARGLGFEMAKNFRANDFNVVLSDINKDNLDKSVIELSNLPGNGKVIGITCNVVKLDDVENLFQEAKKAFDKIDIWVNNAGINQANKHAWELEDKEIDLLLGVDLKGTINGSTVAMRNMIKQGYGSIYNVEGFGSNDAYQEYLVMYGTSKRAVTYFTEALAKESELKHTNVIVGKLSPGIMITKFITSATGNDNEIKLSTKVKRVYNILGDYPDVVAKFLVKNMIKNKKNNKRIMWLTNHKAFFRFMFCAFNRRDFFKEN